MLVRITDFALRNRLLIIMVSVLVIVAGYYSYTRLPIDAFPDVSPNLVQVFTVTEGLAPEEIEKYITYPVETAMNGLPGVVKIRSVSNFGLSVVNIYFEDELDIYFTRRLVNERLQVARGRIPEGFGAPEMGPISTGMGLVLFYYLEDTTGTYSLEELRSIQDWVVKFNLQTVPGVTEVLGIGGYEKQFQVVLHPERLLRFDISLPEFIETIEANNLNVGAQFLERNSEEYIVRSIGLVTTLEDIENIVVKTEGGTPIYLRQVADVKVGGAIRRGLQTRNGIQEVVSGQVIKLFGANASTVIERVEQKMEEINKILPDGIRLVPYYEQKSLVEAAVATVTSALLSGIALVVLVLLVFMGRVRPSIVVAIAIPFSVLFAAILMRRIDLSANLMSLGGIAIAIGMLVDGTIVVVENVERRLREAMGDESTLHIVARACAEVGRPIVFAIAIIIVVFIPLFTLQGVEGKMFRPLAYTVSFAMLGSLLFAIFVAPALSSLILKRKPSSQAGEQAGERGLTKWLLLLYRPAIKFLVLRRWIAVSIAIVLLAIGVSVFPLLGSEFTPALQEGTIVLRLTMAPSIALTETTRITQIVERRLMRIHEITGVVTRIGRGEVGAHTDPVNSAEMYILLLDPDQWTHGRNQQELQDYIRDQLGEIPGVATNFTQPIEMTVDELLEGIRAELAIKLFGDDLDTLKLEADKIARIIAEVPGAADVQVDQVLGTPQLLITVDRHAIARYGINVEDVQKTIQAAVGGVTAGQLFEGIRRYDILVRYHEEHRSTPEQIGDILVRTPSKAWVPLSQLVTMREIVGPRQITREDNQRFITIQCNVVDRDIGSFVADAQSALDTQMDLPPGYLVTWGGQFRLQQEANKRFAIVIPATLLLVLFMLYLSFNSMKNSFLILLNIPLALVGGVVGLWLTGENLSVPSSVGFIALFGIALENGMVLVTCLNQLVSEGRSVNEASIEGASLRLRAVLMTAMTTGLGLAPLIFSSGVGSEIQRPLAIVVVGGLVTSTVLTLLVIPAIYSWFADLPGEEPHRI